MNELQINIVKYLLEIQQETLTNAKECKKLGQLQKSEILSNKAIAIGDTVETFKKYVAKKMP